MGRFAFAFLGAVLALPTAGLAETVRVATWNLESTKGEYVLDAGATNQATEALKDFLPDLIILQGASGWKSCSQLIKSLQPEPYRVAVCSAQQTGASPGGSRREVAILTRHTTYSCWWKPWDVGQNGGSGAYAFAAVQFGKKNLGIFSAELGSKAQGATASAQLLSQVETVKGWTHNEVDTFIIAGCCKGPADDPDACLPGLGRRDFIDACLGFESPPASPACPFLYVDANGFPAHPRMLRAPGPKDTLVLTEVELEPAVVAAARIAHAQERARIILDTAKRAQEADGLSAAMQMKSGSALVAHVWWAVGVLGVMVLAMMITLWKMVRPKRLTFPQSTALLPDLEGEPRQASSITVVLSPRSATTSTAEGLSPASGPIVRIDSEAPTHTHSASWQQRAIAAEHEAARAQQIIRQGLIPQLRRWLQQKLLRKLMADRSEMLTAQRSATQKAQSVNDVLTKIEHQVQQQNRQYERRIEELTLELLATREENRELIRSQISQVRAEMESAAARLRAQGDE